MSAPVTVHNQAELDQALADEAATIYIESDRGVWLQLSQTGSSRVVAWGSSSVVAWESSSVVAWESSSVEARESSRVVAWGSSSVVAWGSSRVEARGSSSVVAWGSSSVVARESSSVVARESSSVVAWESSSVEARESSSVVAWGSSSVEARESSSVEARESSRVVAWGSSSVVAWESSSVEASKYVAVHLYSQRVNVTGNGHIIDLTEIDFSDPAQWCEFHGVEVADGIAHVYKAVGDDWKSDYGTEYTPGSTPAAPDWAPTQACGKGLHFCAHPALSLSYKSDATKFVKCGVRLDEMVCLDDKIKAKRVVVACVEVDLDGRVVEVVA